MDRLIVDNSMPELSWGFFLVGVEGVRSDDRYTHELVQVDVTAGGPSRIQPVRAFLAWGNSD